MSVREPLRDSDPDKQQAALRAIQPLESSSETAPPIIRRAEVVAFCLVALLLISLVAVLYFARAFLMPLVTAMVVGTMLSRRGCYRFTSFCCGGCGSRA